MWAPLYCCIRNIHYYQARERLASRIDQGRIGPGQKPAARLALENLRVLLGRVGIEEREEVLEVDTVGGAEAAIRRKVELELAAAGRKASLVTCNFTSSEFLSWHFL